MSEQNEVAGDDYERFAKGGFGRRQAVMVVKAGLSCYYKLRLRVTALLKATDDGERHTHATYAHRNLDAVYAVLQHAEVSLGLPIRLILHCPMCAARHIDRGKFAVEPHHTHACQECGFVWRPAVEDTVAVEFLEGFKDAE